MINIMTSSIIIILKKLKCNKQKQDEDDDDSKNIKHKIQQITAYKDHHEERTPTRS
jgi:hypothetical protein